MSAQGALRVVIADDAAAMRALLREVLGASPSFRVVGEAADGDEAVRLSAREQPDMVLLDLAMPILDGFGAIPRIRACSPTSRIVVLSGFSAGRMAQRALDVGADAYLEKRDRPDELLARLFAVCDGSATGLYQLAFEQAPIGMAIDGLGANEAFERITAGEAGLLPQPGAQRLTRPDGRVAWVRVGRQGPVTYVVDVTEEQRAEVHRRIVAEDAEELARANADLAHFASVAAHELRSPLQVISGFASLLARSQGEALDERGRDCVHWITNGVARLDTLIDDLLAFAGVGAGERVAVPVDLAAALEPDERVTHGALPTVIGDPQQLRQLLQNLVGNACKFVAQGTTPRVHVSAERTDDGWCVSVADNGVGVDPARAGEIFEMFRRLHSREQYDGTGIGLAICERIVDGHGGRIWVEPNPGGGSVFRFTLPDPPAESPDDAGEERPLTDAATGLPNRAELRYRLERALARAARTHESVSLIWVRIEGSEPADDGAADREVDEIGRRLRLAVRPPDPVGRVGPAAFAVLCAGLAGPDDGQALRDRLVAEMGPGVHVSVATTGPDSPGLSADELLALASQGDGSKR